MGRTGVYVSEILLGTITFGGSDSPIWGPVGGLLPADSTHHGRATW
jgi:aryl-alcohol dehydrogenase-like predicted oxidoreductase